MDTLIRPVDLVDSDDYTMTELERLGENEASLRHRAFGCIHEQDNTVDHLQNALDLTAEIGMARRIDDIDLRIFVVNGGVLGENGDPAFTLQIVGVHDALDDLLILTVYAALLEHLVHERCLAVVDVGDDGNVS